MNNFREWLSDNLRYIMLGGVIIFVGVGSFFGGRFYEQQLGTKKGDVVVASDKGATNKDNSKEELLEKPEGNQIVASEDTKEQSEELTAEEKKIEQEKLDKIAAEEAKKVEEQEKAAQAAQQAEEERKAEEERQAAQAAAKAKAEEEAKEAANIEAQNKVEKKEQEKEEEVFDYSKLPIVTLNTGANMRDRGSYESNVIAEFPAGTKMHLVEDGKGWYKVEVDGVVGYMAGRFFQ